MSARIPTVDGGSSDRVCRRDRGEWMPATRGSISSTRRCAAGRGLRCTTTAFPPWRVPARAKLLVDARALRFADDGRGSRVRART